MVCVVLCLIFLVASPIAWAMLLGQPKSQEGEIYVHMD